MYRFKGGDTAAFALLLQRHEKRVFNYILRFIGGDVQRANDCLQETFLKVIKAAPRYKVRAKFTTWLFTIARNQAIDVLRKQRLRRHVSLDHPLREGGPTLGERTAGLALDGFDSADAEQMRRRIELALATLSEVQREVFIMRQFLHLSFREIAETLAISEGTAKSRMRYALEQLRRELHDYFSELDLGLSTFAAGVRV